MMIWQWDWKDSQKTTHGINRRGQVPEPQNSRGPCWRLFSFCPQKKGEIFRNFWMTYHSIYTQQLLPRVIFFVCVHRVDFVHIPAQPSTKENNRKSGGMIGCICELAKDLRVMFSMMNSPKNICAGIQMLRFTTPSVRWNERFERRGFKGERLYGKLTSSHDRSENGAK